jgi:hypothetical protein
MNQMEVKASKLTFALVILLGLFFVPMGLVSLLSGWLCCTNLSEELRMK